MDWAVMLQGADLPVIALGRADHEDHQHARRECTRPNAVSRGMGFLERWTSYVGPRGLNGHAKLRRPACKTLIPREIKMAGRRQLQRFVRLGLLLLNDLSAGERKTDHP